MSLPRLTRVLCCLLLCAGLLLPGGRAAAASKYTDLPPSHWAYADMDRAAALGIINGMGGGSMAPDAPLTWGQFLAMLTRAFHPDAYQTAVNDGLAWDQAAYRAAVRSGLLPEADFLPVDGNHLSQPLLRQEAAVLLDRVLPQLPDGSGAAQASLSDWGSLPQPYRAPVSRLFDARILRGRDDGRLDGQDPLRRADGSTLLIRALDCLDEDRLGQELPLRLTQVSPGGKTLREGVAVSAWVGDYLPDVLEDALPGQYVPVLEELSVLHVSSIRDSYTLVCLPYDEAELGEDPLPTVTPTDDRLRAMGENREKHQLLFGDPDRRRYDNRQQAEEHMVSITVPIWQVSSNGARTTATTRLQIHESIASDVISIFTEIYNSPEQFPIHALGGYSWRGDSATGEHNCGTAIDINYNENYQIREGRIETGSLWEPGENPYSIAPDSSVVRVFQSHGWSWGGDAWAGHSDDSTGYHDYMHFSYMGW